jgi:hypothetical protein
LYAVIRNPWCSVCGSDPSGVPVLLSISPLTFDEMDFDDYLYYIELLSEFSTLAETGIWAYCLTPNHVHPLG